MKILLLKDIKGLGRRNELKEVSDGYARNYLIPKKLAVIANEKAVQLKLATDAKEEALISELKAVGEALSKTELEFIVKTGKMGEVFGSIGPEEIRSEILKQWPRAEKLEAKISQPLKRLGDHFVTIALGRGITAKVKITLLPER